MSGKRHASPTYYTDAVSVYGSMRAAAAELGVRLAAMQQGIAREKARAEKKQADDLARIRIPKFPDTDEPIGEVISRLAIDISRHDARAAAEKWFPVHVQDDKPIGIMWFGDPHLGVSTKWDRLQRDVMHCATVPGLYGANMGDTTDNWVGSLMRLYANTDLSRKNERRLAKWFLAEAGISWLVWLMGNHDEWNEGSDVLRLMNIHSRVPMLDWKAQFELIFPGGKKIRIHAKHDFPGHSMWNPTHGPARAPRMLGDGADLYVTGHKHTWGIQHFEMPEANRCPLAIRARGYKTHDEHSRRLGFPEDQNGCAIMTIIDPTAGPAGRVLAFVDTDQGARVLQALRNERAPVRKPAPKRKSKAKGRKK